MLWKHSLKVEEKNVNEPSAVNLGVRFSGVFMAISTDPTPIVSPEWLQANLAHPDLVIVDCRFSLADPQLGRHQYQTSHIPGAYYLDLNQDLSGPVDLHGGRHPLPEPAKLAQKLSRMGMNPQTQIVAYDDSRFAFAARLWWLLRYLGHDRVAVLGGGFSGYQAQRFPLTSAQPGAREGTFTPQPGPDRWVDVATVQARKDQPEVVLVDSRAAERYRGDREPIDPVAGHIPAAVNYPWQAVSTPEGKLRSLAEQQSHWANLHQAEEVIVYCGSGVTACVNLLSLELAGIKTAKLYPGSWSDWCSYPTLPVALGEA